MNRTWSIEYCPIPDKYLLMIWLNDKSYYLDISREFAEMLGGACTADSFYEQEKTKGMRKGRLE